MAVIGIPTTRVSDLFIRERMLRQVQTDQATLFRVMMQLSTGRRFEAPSEDPVAALRVISLQSLLERKAQVQNNLTTNQSFLSASDTALSNVSGLLAEVRGLTLGVIGTTATDVQRQTAVQQIDQVIRQLVDTGNTQFRGRYLFAGSQTTVLPFAISTANIVGFLGNEGHLQSYADVDLLFATNLSGSEVFGAVSEPVRGTADFHPVLTLRTRLDDLRSGLGISGGSIAVSDGLKTSIVDLSGAATIGDVAALIKANPPPGRELFVDVTPAGLVVTLAGADGALSIREVGGGTVAAELGILRETGLPTPIVGEDLAPVLRPTTALSDCFGARAVAFLHSIGPDNDIIVEADVIGPELPDGTPLNGVAVRYVGDVSAGGEYVEYVPGVEIVVHVDPARTEARQVVELINAFPDLPFTARLDPLDATHGGKGVVQVSAEGRTDHGVGSEFDKDSGLQILNGGRTHTIGFSTARTVEDLLNALNGAGAGLLAEINPSRTGIDVRSRSSGADFAIGENGGATATQLGIRTFGRETRLQDVHHGHGVRDWPGYGGPDTGIDFTITRIDGVEIPIDVTGLETIGEVIDAINNHLDNDGQLEARLAAFGNGIELIDRSVGAGKLAVTRAPMSKAAIDLGLLPPGEDSISSDDGRLTGADCNPLETEGVFTALLRIRAGLQANDLFEVQRGLEMLDRAATNLNFARGELGARQQGLAVLQNRLDDEVIELRKNLSLEYDVPIEEVVSTLTARQVAYEASLRAMGTILQMSLLDYL
jgi:flagellin-like hook-associated protein FlgL